MISRDHRARCEPTLDQLRDFMLGWLSKHTGYSPWLFDISTALEVELHVDVGAQMQLLRDTIAHFRLEISAGGLCGLQLGGRCSLGHLIDALSLREPMARRISSAEWLRTERTARPHCPVPIVVCSGTPYEIGFQHGRDQAEQARAMGHKFMKVEQLLKTRLATKVA